MRQFNSIWFGGNGKQSLERKGLLHTILDNALSNLSGCQQPAHNYDDTEERKQTKKEIKDAADDIYVALTGEQSFTIEEFKKYLLTLDSRGDIMHYLSEENVIKANEPEEDEDKCPRCKGAGVVSGDVCCPTYCIWKQINTACILSEENVIKANEPEEDEDKCPRCKGAGVVSGQGADVCCPTCGGIG